MHVCHLLHHLANGGLEQQVLELVRHSDGDIEYTVAYLDDDDSLAADLRSAGANVVDLEITSGPKSVFNPLSIRRLSKFLADREFDLLHIHTPLYVHVMGRIAAARSGPEHVVGTYHNPREQFHPAMQYLERATRRLSSVNVGVSMAVEQSFTGSGTVYDPDQGLSGNSCTIYNGIDVEGFAERVQSTVTEKVREKYGLHGKTVFLNIGRYSPQKAQADLIHAMDKVIEEIPESHLMIVGWGTLEEELKETVREYDLEDYVTVTGKVPSVPEYYAVADVFVLSSIQEGLPIVILEAMAAGLPLIVTDVSGNSEAVPKDAGLLVPPGSPEIFSEKMIGISSSGRYNKENRIFEYGRQNFHVKDTAESYRYLYTSLID